MMQVYCAENCETMVEAEVEDLGAGAGRVRCLECGGDGDWSKFALGMVPPRNEMPRLQRHWLPACERLNAAFPLTFIA